MARAKLKTEMKGTGGGRWTTRADAKESSDGRRRELDKAEVEAGLEEWRTLPEFRVAACEPGIDPRAVSGTYVRAANETEARLKARQAGLHVTARARVHVERWKEPGQ